MDGAIILQLMPLLARLILSLLLVAAAFSAPAEAQTGNVTLQFMASDANWAGLAGHAFMCIQRRTGPAKEECFGFYVRKSGKGLVGGPGVVDREFDFSKTPPTRFTHVKASVTRAITPSQRQRLLSFIRGFDKDFSVTPANCISFANGVAKLAGLKTPASTTLTPVQYLNELRKLNSPDRRSASPPQARLWMLSRSLLDRRMFSRRSLRNVALAYREYASAHAGARGLPLAALERLAAAPILIRSAAP